MIAIPLARSKKMSMLYNYVIIIETIPEGAYQNDATFWGMTLINFCDLSIPPSITKCGNK